MKVLLVLLLVLFLPLGIASAFEIEGFKVGMSRQEVKVLLEKLSYDLVGDYEKGIIGLSKRTKRAIGISFCNDKLVMVDKGLDPRFDYFTKLIKQLRNDLGKPTDAWSEPADPISDTEMDSIFFLWKLPNHKITVKYVKFEFNYQLGIIYKTYHECW